MNAPLEEIGRIDSARQRQVLADLRKVLPDDCLLYREEDTRPYDCDALTSRRRRP